MINNNLTFISYSLTIYFDIHDDTGYMVKYIDPWPKTGSKFIHLTLSRDLFISDVISNPPIRARLHGLHLILDQIARS